MFVAEEKGMIGSDGIKTRAFVRVGRRDGLV